MMRWCEARTLPGMRTTLTLDDDVAAALERRRADRGTRLRQEVNELLRVGLAAADRPSPDPNDYELPTFDPGRPLVTDSRALAELLDTEDVERATPAQS